MVSDQPALQRQEDEEEVQTKPLATSITPLIQRQEDEEEIQTKPIIRRRVDGDFDASPELESHLSANKGDGSPLPAGTRTYMEPRFGTDFGGVRVHTGAEADQLSRSIQAQAFTHGSDIYLGAGRYDPGSDQGRRLLAHELTHVVQQTGGETLSAQSTRPVQISAKRAPGVQRAFDVAQFYQSLDGDTEAAVVALLRKWKGRTTLASTRRKYVSQLMWGAEYYARSDVAEVVYENHDKIFRGEMAPDPAPPPILPKSYEKESSDAKMERLRELLPRLQARKEELDGILREQEYQDKDPAEYVAEAQDVLAQIGGLAQSGLDISGQLGMSGTAAKTIASTGGGAKLDLGASGFAGLRGGIKAGAEKGEVDVSASAEAEFLAGAQQDLSATLTLENKYASAITTLKEQGKLGAWGRTKAEVQAGLNKGISADLAAYLALGGQLKLEGKFDVKTQAGGVGLILEGEGRVFAGAEAGADISFAAGLVEGIQAGVSAGAFAGVRAELDGQWMFQLFGRTLFGTESKVGVEFGAGASVEAAVKLPVFGDSEIRFGADTALGLGFSSDFTIKINAGNIVLSAKDLWTRLQNLPSIMRGYGTELTMRDAEILQNLTKLIDIYAAAIKQTQGEIDDFEKTPEAERTLLAK